MPRFSVITATFNAGILFDRTYASLRQQTLRDFEWLVVDGGSTDDTLERIHEAGSLVSWRISERDEGIADAWNKGIAHAGGDYVLILNAGDTYDPRFLEVINSACDGERIVCSHARLRSDDGRDLGVFRAQPHKLCIAMHVPHNWCAVPRHYYSLLGSYRHIPLAMDFEWFHRYYKTFGVEKFRVVDEVLGTYHFGGASDHRYIESFKWNERILVENGMNGVAARLLRVSYSLKHALKKSLMAIGLLRSPTIA